MSLPDKDAPEPFRGRPANRAHVEPLHRIPPHRVDMVDGNLKVTRIDTDADGKSRERNGEPS